MRETTELKLWSALAESDFSLLAPLPEKLTRKTKILLVCGCGRYGYRRVSDLIAGVKSCRTCCAVNNNAIGRTRGPNGEPKHKRYYTEEDRVLKDTFAGAKRRCDIKSGNKNYAGRGIKFNFPSVADAVAWAKSSLPPRPEGYTLDRIDNDGHYEPGNLRWASRRTQRLNQREHFRGNENTNRIQALCQARPDYSYESIRSFVVAGLTDKEILEKKKGKHNGNANSKNL